MNSLGELFCAGSFLVLACFGIFVALAAGVSEDNGDDSPPVGCARCLGNALMIMGLAVLLLLVLIG